MSNAETDQVRVPTSISPCPLCGQDELHDEECEERLVAQAEDLEEQGEDYRREMSRE